jgi:hypothetical protein
MRALAVFAVMIAPAMGFSLRDILKNQVEPVEADVLPKVRGNAREGTETDSIHRTLKGSGKGGSKGSAPACETITVYSVQTDYTKSGVLLGDFGEALEGLPLYEKKTKKILGTITETVIDAGEGEDCTAVGSINFGLKNAKSGRTKNQLLYQGTCTGGLTNALTGGTGQFDAVNHDAFLWTGL